MFDALVYGLQRFQNVTANIVLAVIVVLLGLLAVWLVWRALNDR